MKLLDQHLLLSLPLVGVSLHITQHGKKWALKSVIS